MQPKGARHPTDWRSVASETADYCRRIGVVPVAVLAGAVAAVAAVSFLVGVRVGSPPPIDLPVAGEGSPPPIATTQPASLRVHLAGAVRAPGLYEVPAGHRVGDLIEDAGGTTRDADVAAVNLAERVRDGQQVYVPREGEAPAGAGQSGRASAGAAAAAGLVNVNTATAAELEALPGIGPSLAAAIISFRTEHGPFPTLDALEAVPGIGPAKLSQLRPHATV